ncbi:LysR family transcriptional regulator [Bosea sp. CS1GBMeth4]|uniref:LysR family transcriptional regulator n=1 Tax=Bosea sp. CS1GBMeth4 TaxID=1892849 RepID=UPI001647ED43|nr:LysR family transcriptional regulator [Bosea sp. CS1GBMeth4]
MDSRKLRYFAVTARLGSFSRAAEELRVAQPALSRRIREIEDELGQPLFSRHGRGVRLTAFGASVLQKAEEIEHLIGQIRREAREPHRLQGKVALGMPPAAALRIGPPLAARIRQSCPEVMLSLRDGVSSLIQEWLIGGRIDLGVTYNATPMDGLEIVPLLREQAVLVGPPAGALADGGRESIRLRDIAGLPLIMPSLPHNNRRVLEEAAARHEVRLVIRAEVDSVALTKALVRDGQGYTILSHASVEDEVRRGELSRRAIDSPPVFADLSLVATKAALEAPLKRHVALELRRLLTELCESGAWPGATLPNQKA